jgi:hypothetical protein
VRILVNDREVGCDWLGDARGAHVAHFADWLFHGDGSSFVVLLEDDL